MESLVSEPILTPVQVPEPKTKFPVIYLVLSLLVFVFLVSTAFLYYQNIQLKNMLVSYQTQPTVLPTPIVYQSPVSTTDPTTNWKTYENNYWKISFKYPDTMFKPCFNYTTEKEGIRFWGPQFNCPDGHDILYKIGFVGYDLGKYIEYKKPSSTETIVVDNKQAQRKTYVYDESDGPLSSLKQSTEVVFGLSNGTMILQQLGDNAGEQKVFDQILSTLHFLK